MMMRNKGMEKFVLTGKATETLSSIILNLLRSTTEAHALSLEMVLDTTAMCLLRFLRQDHQPTHLLLLAVALMTRALARQQINAFAHQLLPLETYSAVVTFDEANLLLVASYKHRNS
mmetsp:Transcript_8546/g.15522  ORF Transcript_8546/g.15522 Transcript_8546/m.15522 type:complete len:117 (+) Transcript_8546:48-398(+)